ncbi:hypothetical protein [Fredinandcohnia sp. 179-A 10B2 NHS]|uniref:hypothetical protein n=1 Tax=Fredinandcohnia sp. 179-A 10B2 NHS TaxID=3235176 RepID=UPI0039A1F500
MRYIYLILLISCFLFLTGCESQEEIDQLVREYVQTKYDVEEIEFIYRESKNEGNMGDRTYIVKSKKEPSFEFDILLDGIMKSEVVGDDYKKQAEAYEIGQAFESKYRAELNQLGYALVNFSRAQDRTASTELEVSVVSERTISLNNEQSLKDLYQIFAILQEYNENLKEDFLVYNLLIDYPYKDKTESLTFYYNVTDITSYEKLTSALAEDIHFVNLALQEKYQSTLVEMEKEIKKLGFSYREGLNDSSIFCYGKDLSGQECLGFTIYLSGADKSEGNLTALKAVIKEFDIPIGEVVIANTGGAIVLEGFN